MADDKLKLLYTSLKSNPNIQGLPDDYETFSSALSDTNTRKQFYDTIKSNPIIQGLPDDYNTFNTTLFSSDPNQKIVEEYLQPVTDKLADPKSGFMEGLKGIGSFLSTVTNPTINPIGMTYVSAGATQNLSESAQGILNLPTAVSRAVSGKDLYKPFDFGKNQVFQVIEDKLQSGKELTKEEQSALTSFAVTDISQYVAGEGAFAKAFPKIIKAVEAIKNPIVKGALTGGISGTGLAVAKTDADLEDRAIAGGTGLALGGAVGGAVALIGKIPISKAIKKIRPDITGEEALDIAKQIEAEHPTGIVPDDITAKLNLMDSYKDLKGIELRKQAIDLGIPETEIKGMGRLSLIQKIEQVKSEQPKGVANEIPNATAIKELDDHTINSHVDEHINTNQEEVKQFANESGITEDVAKEQINNNVQSALKNPDHINTLSGKLKNIVSNIVLKIKKAIIYGLISLNSISGVGKELMSQDATQWAYRGAVNYGLVDMPKEVKVRIPTTTIRVNDNGVKVVGIVKDLTTNKNLLLAQRTFKNSEGANYVPVPSKGAIKTNGVSADNTIGMAHFLFGNDVFNFRSENKPDLIAHSNQVKEQLQNQSMYNWEPVINTKGSQVVVRYKQIKDIDEKDTVLSTAVNYNFDDINFNSNEWVGGSGGFGQGASKDKRTLTDVYGNKLPSFVFTNKDTYSKFSGTSGVFIIPSKDGTIIHEMNGSINMIKDAGEKIKKEFNLQDGELKLLVFDAGSYSAKPASINGKLMKSEYSGYNPTESSGSGLAYPSNEITKEVGLTDKTVLGSEKVAIKNNQQSVSGIDTPTQPINRSRAQELADQSKLPQESEPNNVNKKVPQPQPKGVANEIPKEKGQGQGSLLNETGGEPTPPTATTETKVPNQVIPEGMKEKKSFTTAQESGAIDKDAEKVIKENQSNLYETDTMKAVSERAQKIYDDIGFEESKNLLLNDKSPLNYPEQVSLHVRVVNEFKNRAQEAKAKGDVNLENEIIDAHNDYWAKFTLGTKLGQAVNQFKEMRGFNVDNYLRMADKAVDMKYEKEKLSYDKLFPKERAKVDPNRDELAVKIRTLAKKIDAEKVELRRDVHKRYNEIQNIKQDFKRQEAEIDLLNHIKKQMKPSNLDLYMALSYSSMLSGIGTQAVNLASTGANVLGEAFIQSALHPEFTDEIFSALIRGLEKGKLESGAVLKSGKLTGTRSQSLEVGSPIELHNFAGGKFNPANYAKYVNRAMGASDVLWFKGAEEMKSTVLAYELAKTEGLTGTKLHARVSEILGNTAEVRAQAEATALADGFKPESSDFKRYVNEIINKKRSIDLQLKAKDYALNATYNTNTPDGVLGKASSLVDQMSQSYPLLKAWIPFTKIVANVTNKQIEWTPLGFARTGLKWRKGAYLKNPESLSEDLVRSTIGTLALTTLAYNFADRISGTGTGDPTKDAQLRETGWRPNSINIGDKYVNFSDSPMSIGLSLIGNYNDAIRYKKMDKRDANNRLFYAMSMVPNTIVDKSFLQGFKSLTSSISTPPSASKNYVVEGAKLLTTPLNPTIPRIVYEIGDLFDNSKYTANDIESALTFRIPIVKKMNKPEINILGDPTTKQLRIYTNETNNKIFGLLRDKGVFLSVPDKTNEFEDRSGNIRIMSPNEYYDFIKYRGNIIKDKLNNQYFRLRQLSPDKFADELVKIQTDATKKAKSKINK